MKGVLKIGARGKKRRKKKKKRTRTRRSREKESGRRNTEEYVNTSLGIILYRLLSSFALFYFTSFRIRAKLYVHIVTKQCAGWRYADREIERHRDIPTDRQTDRQTNRLTNRLTGRRLILQINTTN